MFAGKKLDLLLDTFRRIKALVSEKEIAREALRTLQEEKGYKHVGILLVNKGEITSLYSTEPIEEDRIRIDKGLVGWAIQNKKTRVVGDVREDPYCIDVLPSVKSKMVVPIMEGEDVLGVISIESEEIDAFGKVDVFDVKLLAEFLYTVLKKVRLLDDWVERTRELGLVFEIVKDIAGRHSLREFAMRLVHKIMEVKGFPAVGLLKVEDSKLSVVYWKNVMDRHAGLSQTYVDIDGKGIVARAARTGKIQNVPDVSRDPDYIGAVKETRSELAIPIKVGDRVVGVLNVESDRLSAFAQEDEEFLSMLADITANIMDAVSEYERAEDSQIQLQESFRSLQELNVELEGYISKLSAANKELEQMKTELQNAYTQTIKSLAKAIERKDPYTHGHSERVAEYSVELGKMIGLSEGEQRLLLYAGLLHDIGKIGVSERILNKTGKLTDEEYEEIKKHPVYGAEIVGEILLLKDVSVAIMHHHERWDGGGYPAGLKGANIPLFSRIMAIADTYDAMTSERSYRRAFTVEETLKELERGKGRQFDPYLVELFIGYIKGRFSL